MVFATTIFLSAFLLFQVQPLISKSILPWFGGTPSVWTTCMLFFQVVLFGGYAYAHGLIHRVSPRGQLIVHLGLMLSALCVLPITPSTTWKPDTNANPSIWIVMLLSANVGLPFFVLSATGPLLQAWFGRSTNGRSPYRLYAVSNAGSLLALISYPFLVEPKFATTVQAELWSWTFGAFTVCCALCGWQMCRSANPSSIAAPEASLPFAKSELAPTWGRRAMWFGLSMMASVMLLATTNQVCLDVASVPFLWVLPLSLYLMSFILCFDSDRWYSRRTFSIAMFVSFAGISVVLLKGSGGSLIAQVLVYMAGLFFCAMVCHGELVRLKPAAKHLTAFYLVMAAGGAAGGIFVGLIAPLIFPAFLELHVGLLGCTALVLLVFFGDRSWVLHAGRPRWAWGLVLIGVFAFTAVLRVQADTVFQNAVTVTRNFYGVLKVQERDADDPKRHRFRLMHGRIVHGLQFVLPSKQMEPTTYYGRNSGVGLILDREHRSHPQRVGVVGLGVGTLAAYARSGDEYRFYEINPEVTRLAKRYFSYLAKCPGEVSIATGDARLLLEHEAPHQFDTLVLDAFSGDAIPAHLLTLEAFGIYLKHLKNEGILAIHYSNLHFDLEPVIAAAADHHGLTAVAVMSDGDENLGTKPALWMLLARNPNVLKFEKLQTASHALQQRRVPWTDNRSNMFEILK